MTVVITAAARTAFGRFGGRLAGTPTITLGAHVIRAAVERSRIPAARVDSVYMGICLPTGGMTPARMAALEAGLGLSVRSLSIDRACCSAMTAIGQAAAMISAGEATWVVAGGMENMSRTPLLVPSSHRTRRVSDLTLEDPLVIRNPYLNEPMARYTGAVSLEYGVDRRAQDEWAVQSQQRWREAQERGRFRDEIVPIDTEDGGADRTPFGVDEHPRPGTTLMDLARLPTVYGSPTVTSGNAPGLNDGAAAVVLAEASTARAAGIASRAEVLAYVAICGEPRQSVRLPADAIRTATAKAGVALDDLAVVEINEAFAATALVSTQVLADGDPERLRKLRERTNPNGGAVAIGHPIGASGARLVMTLVAELELRGGGIGAAAICGGVGQADAVIVKVT